MTVRDATIAAFLATTPYATWAAQPIAVDASTRNYTRLIGPNDASAILMDADPARGNDTGPFLTIGTQLRAMGLTVPETLHADLDNGLLVITDLGTADFARWLHDTPDDTRTLYTAALDVLAQLHSATPPADLPRLDPVTAGQMIDVTADWYAPEAAALIAPMADAMAQLAPPPTVLALRDFHAENLIWRPDQKGTDRVGLLDYQDAFVAPPGYDLISLLRDARRDVDRDLAAQLIRDFAQRIGQDPADFAATCACLSVQRNLRILGVFARLIRRDGKPKYAGLLPRVWAHIKTDAAHPALHALAPLIAQLPPPEALLQKVGP